MNFDRLKSLNHQINRSLNISANDPITRSNMFSMNYKYSGGDDISLHQNQTTNFFRCEPLKMSKKINNIQNSCEFCPDISKKNYQLKRKIIDMQQNEVEYSQLKKQLDAMNQLYQLKCDQVLWQKDIIGKMNQQLTQIKSKQMQLMQDGVNKLKSLLKNQYPQASYQANYIKRNQPNYKNSNSFQQINQESNQNDF